MARTSDRRRERVAAVATGGWACWSRSPGPPVFVFLLDFIRVACMIGLVGKNWSSGKLMKNPRNCYSSLMRVMHAEKLPIENNH